MRRLRRVLGLDPTSRGFGFAVVEDPERLLIEAGLVYATPAETARRLGELLDRLRPDTVVLEDTRAAGSRRRPPIEALLSRLHAVASERGLRVRLIARRAALRRLAAETKEAAAERLAETFPELARRVPPRRKAWMSEDNRTGLFDALTLVLAALPSPRRHGSNNP